MRLPSGGRPPRSPQRAGRALTPTSCWRNPRAVPAHRVGDGRRRRVEPPCVPGNTRAAPREPTHVALDLTLPALSHVCGGRGWRSGLRAATLLVLAMLVSACTAGPTSPTGPEGGTGAPRGAEASSAGAAPTSAAPVTPVATCANLAQRPSSPPAGAVTASIPTSVLTWRTRSRRDRQAPPSGWPRAPHLGQREFSQVAPKAGDAFIGAPGAVLDGRGSTATRSPATPRTSPSGR